MRWRLLGLATVMRAAGPDITKAAAGRCDGEGVWLPSALLPRVGVRWSARDDDHIVAAFSVATTPIELHLRIDSDGRVVCVVFDRWGDPDQTGTFGWHPFGGDITDHQTVDGLTVANQASWGWFDGTDRWHDGEFFRCRITGYKTMVRAALVRGTVRHLVRTIRDCDRSSPQWSGRKRGLQHGPRRAGLRKAPG